MQTQPSQDDRTLAVLTHLGGMLFGFLVPLVVYLVARESRPWLAEEGREALNFQLTVLIAEIVSGMLVVVFIGIALAALVWLFNVIFCIIAAVQTSQGVQYRYPITFRLIK